MKSFLISAACLTLVAGTMLAAERNHEQKRLENCGVVMQEIVNIPENIPQEVLELLREILRKSFSVGAKLANFFMDTRCH
ncbi:MAG: hypothetical protein WCE61_11815 [Candidatus Acidiferrum sp.]